MSPDFPSEMLVAVTFAEHEGKMKLTVYQTFIDTVMTCGAQEGWTESFDRLAEERRRPETFFARTTTLCVAAGRHGGGVVMTYALWIVQGLLGLIFLFAGGMKLVVPLEVLTKQMPLPGLFVRFIGVAEVLGAIGLILPGLLRIRPGLTPLAAAGLVIIMIGATVLTVAGGDVALALIPLVVGLLSAFVAYGRWRLAPDRGPTGSRNAESGYHPLSTGS